jgi:hypothetical protein
VHHRNSFLVGVGHASAVPVVITTCLHQPSLEPSCPSELQVPFRDTPCGPLHTPWPTGLQETMGAVTVFM